jgi:hypothetical protein
MVHMSSAALPYWEAWADSSHCHDIGASTQRRQPPSATSMCSRLDRPISSSASATLLPMRNSALAIDSEGYLALVPAGREPRMVVERTPLRRTLTPTCLFELMGVQTVFILTIADICRIDQAIRVSRRAAPKMPIHTFA